MPKRKTLGDMLNDLEGSLGEIRDHREDPDEVENSVADAEKILSDICTLIDEVQSTLKETVGELDV